MRLIINKSQFLNLLNEQDGKTMPFQIEKSGYIQGKPETVQPALKKQDQSIKSIKKIREKNPKLFDFLTQLGLWFIPVVGPILSTGYGLGIGINYLSQGKYMEGILEIICSPPMLGLMVKLGPVMKIELGAMKNILLTIHKSGITLLISKGQQEFLEWGIKNFGDDFLKFMKWFENIIPQKFHGSFFNNMNKSKL